MNMREKEKKLKALERTTQKIKMLALYEEAKRTDFTLMK